MMTEPGGAYFDDAEAAALHDGILKGGFLGRRFLSDYACIWAREIGKAFPPERYPIIIVPLDHQLFHAYDIKHSRRFRRSISGAATGGLTSERGVLSAQPHVSAILDDDVA